MTDRARLVLVTPAPAAGEEWPGALAGRLAEALSPGAIFVNVSRGTVVDEAALLDALRAGRIGAAGLDVFLNEPNIDPEFLTFPNVLLQPHAASGSFETRKDMGRLMRDNVAAAMAGRPLPTRIA